MSAPAQTTAPAAGSVLTPTVGARFRQARFWLVLLAVVLVGAVILLLINGQGSTARGDLDPESPYPAGSQAVAEVLRNEGVTVHVAGSLAEAEELAADDATVLVNDAPGLLSADQLDRVIALGGRTVFVQPTFATLDRLGLAVALGPVAGSPSDETLTLAANCSLPAATLAGTITGRGTSYTALDPIDGWSGCFADTAGDPAVVTINGAHPLTLLGVSDVLRNDTITQEGNAALALGLLGQADTLVWYTSSLADAAGDAPPTTAELMPGWTQPLLLLLGVAAIVAGLWRGRRLGPLTVENLPVTVKAGETTEGRARLYAGNLASEHAARVLRDGTVHRLSLLLGVADAAPQVIPVVAGLTDRTHAEVHGLLIGTEPVTDRQLADLGRALLALERDARTRIHGTASTTGTTSSAGTTSTHDHPRHQEENRT